MPHTRNLCIALAIAPAVGLYSRSWDVHPDGRFLMSDGGSGDVTPLEVVINWRRELERLRGEKVRR
jgi:hypothetical protein